VTRRREEKDRLLRLVLGPEGQPFVDVLGKAPGRGVYVAPDELGRALEGRALVKAFRGKAKGLAPEEVGAFIEETLSRLEERVAEILGLARRAGEIAIGMDATLARIAESETRRSELVVVTARDLSARSQGKIEEALRGRERVTAFRASNVARLGRALGREAVGIAAVWHPSFSRALAREGERIAGLERSSEASTVG
jgi:uncharacterized protein